MSNMASVAVSTRGWFGAFNGAMALQHAEWFTPKVTCFMAPMCAWLCTSYMRQGPS